jgi:FAD/FMN-containing dehydrogenase
MRLSGDRFDAAWSELSACCRGPLSREPRELEAFSRDFGGVVRKRPFAVLRPANEEDVVAALEIAAAHQVPVATRGAGHSQAGQGLGDGLLLDMTGLDRILSLDPDAELIEVEAGATWRSVIDAAFAVRRLPAGLTHVTNPTVGGTLSVAGVGAEAWRVGPQVDNVAFLDVATLDGEIRRCSPSSERQLFDAVRGGLGQCGVILRAGYPIRPCKARVRSEPFLYLDAAAFMADVERACSDERPDFVTGLFVKRAEGVRDWGLLLILGYEYDPPHAPAARSLRAELHFDEAWPARDDPLWCSDGFPGHAFFHHYAPVPGSVDADPAVVHPWVDHLFSRRTAAELVSEFLRAPSPVLALGTNLMIFIRRRPDPAPLFAVPEAGALSWGLGLFPAAPAVLAGAVVAMMHGYSDQWCAVGGKRYLSGLVDFPTMQAWVEHFGDAWSRFHDAKNRFDPGRLLGSGFIVWDAPAP